MYVRNFVNLTNGIEKIPDLPAGWAAVRIESTTIEHDGWDRLLADLDHNLLFWLSQGAECRVYDFGCRRRTSKTISLAVPLVRDVLAWAWLETPRPPGLCGQVIDDVWRATTELKQEAKRKILYYRKLLQTETVRLFGFSEATEHDGDFDYYRRLLTANIRY